MTKVRLPDGSIEIFPADMNNAQIEAILRKRFRPTELRDGESITRSATDASVTYNGELNRFIVTDADGNVRAFRKTLSEAIDLADMLRPPPPARHKPEPQPKPEPSRQELVAAEHQLVADIDSHIRQSEGRIRREQRQSALRAGRRNRSTL